MEQLAWLPAHSDFAGALKWARQEADAERRLSQLIELCGYRRDFVATEKLDRSIGACLATLEAGASATQLQPARLAILSSHTVDHVAPAIRIAALGRRIALSTHVAGYGLYRQALMDGERTLSSFAPQFLLLALDAHEVQSGVPLDASEQRPGGLGATSGSMTCGSSGVPGGSATTLKSSSRPSSIRRHPSSGPTMVSCRDRPGFSSSG